MRNVNKVIIIGNLTRDPEIRQTPLGQYIATFGIATNREWITKDEEKHKSTEFHDAVAWSRLAEICGARLKRGNLVYIEGYLKTRSWDTPEGFKKFKTEIIVEDLIILEKRSSSKSEEEFIPEKIEAQSSVPETENKKEDKKNEDPSINSELDILDINKDLKL